MSSKAPACPAPVSGAARKARERKRRAQARHVTWLADLCNCLASHHTFAEDGGKAWQLVTTLRDELQHLQRRFRRLEDEKMTGKMKDVQDVAGTHDATTNQEEKATHNEETKETPDAGGAPHEESADGSEHQRQTSDEEEDESSEDLTQHIDQAKQRQDESFAVLVAIEAYFQQTMPPEEKEHVQQKLGSYAEAKAQYFQATKDLCVLEERAGDDDSDT